MTNKPTPTVLTEEMKTWFGQGEWDIDLMIRMGVIAERQVLEYVNALTDSPWYSKIVLP